MKEKLMIHKDADKESAQGGERVEKKPKKIKKLQSIKDTPEFHSNSYAISTGVKKAVEKAIHDTNVKVPK